MYYLLHTYQQAYPHESTGLPPWRDNRRRPLRDSAAYGVTLGVAGVGTGAGEADAEVEGVGLGEGVGRGVGRAGTGFVGPTTGTWLGGAEGGGTGLATGVGSGDEPDQSGGFNGVGSIPPMVYAPSSGPGVLDPMAATMPCR